MTQHKLNLFGDYTYAFTTEKGFDFFLDKDLTKHAADEGFRRGKPLVGYEVYVVAQNGTAVDRVLVNKKHEMIYNSHNLEQMACRIDAMRFAQKE